MRWRSTAWSGRRPAVAGLALLCLFWSAGHLRFDLLPDTLPGLLPPAERQALPLLMLALVSGLTSLLRRTSWPRGQKFRDALLTGAGLFVLPTALLYLAGGRVSPLAVAALFTLVPVFSVVLEPHLGGEQQHRAALPAALAAVAGALLVFPVSLPESNEAFRGFCFVVLAAFCIAWANCLAVRTAQPSEDIQAIAVPSPPATGAFACVAATTGAAGLFLLTAIAGHPVMQWSALAPELEWSAAIELPGLLLLFWLMPRLSATRIATRYIWPLLLPVLILAAMPGARFNLRMWTGIALMAAGAGLLLFLPSSKTASEAQPLHLNGE